MKIIIFPRSLQATPSPTCSSLHIGQFAHSHTQAHTHKYTLAAKQPTWHKEIGSCPFRTLRQGQAGRDRGRQAARQKREGGRVWSMANCILNEVCVCFALTLGWNCLEFVTHLGESTGHDDGPNKMDAVSGR